MCKFSEHSVTYQSVPTRRKRQQLWSRAAIPADCDLQLIAENFESEEQCCKLIASLPKRAASVDPKLFSNLEQIRGCSAQHMCGVSGCPRCAREVRRVNFAQAARRLFCDDVCAAFIVTIALEDAAANGLAAKCPRRLADNLRSRISRASIEGLRACIGGIEAAWDDKKQLWKIHAHLLMLGASMGEIKRCLAKKFGIGRRAVKVQPLRNPVAQISYLLKFSTGYRPQGQTGRTKPQLVPLPKERRVELLTWWAQSNFSDFIFLYGGKRRGSSIDWGPHLKARKVDWLRAYVPT
jgi:hypothetical protein